MVIMLVRGVTLDGADKGMNKSDKFNLLLFD